MEVLLEYRGSRRPVTVSSGENLTQCVTRELRNVGRSRAVVHTAGSNLASNNERDVYILQRWSAQWDCFIDIRHLNEVSDGDRLTVVGKPKPPSKIVQLLCCCIASPDFGVTPDQGHGVSKNEEIQAVDYKFSVEQETVSNWDSQSLVHTEEQGDDDAQYVRDATGRAGWKMVPKSEQEIPAESAELEEASHDQEQASGEVDDTPVDKSEETSNELEAIADQTSGEQSEVPVEQDINQSEANEISDQADPAEINDQTDPAEINDQTDPADINDHADPDDLTEPAVLIDQAEPGDLTEPANINDQADPDDLTEPADINDKDQAEPADINDQTEPDNPRSDAVGDSDDAVNTTSPDEPTASEA